MKMSGESITTSVQIYGFISAVALMQIWLPLVTAAFPETFDRINLPNRIPLFSSLVGFFHPSSFGFSAAFKIQLGWGRPVFWFIKLNFTSCRNGHCKMLSNSPRKIWRWKDKWRPNMTSSNANIILNLYPFLWE